MQAATNASRGAMTALVAATVGLVQNDIKKVTLDPSLLDDKEMLEDLIVVALKDAFQKIDEATSKKMGGLVPPGMNLPF